MINGLRSNGSSGAASLVGPAADALAAPRRAFRTTAEVRSAFIDFFADKAAHSRWPSSPVVPHDDPTLLFINAGMNQFKPLFLGQCKEGTAMSKLKRAANSQKCIRLRRTIDVASGILDTPLSYMTTLTTRQLELRRLLQEEAIAWAWQLLTEVYRIPPERLYVTYFEGNEALGVPADTEARDIWAKYVPPERILAGNMKDNFWEMGDTGPCGPCSEIHYDRIGGRDASHLVNDGCVGRNGEPIPAKGAVVKGHTVGVPDPNMSNYDIDVFAALFKAIQAVVPGLREYAGKVGEDMEDAAKWTEDERVDMAFRVVADHIRTLTFAITDGAQPSAEGRGYVLRRILRRAVRYGGEILKARPSPPPPPPPPLLIQSSMTPVGFFHQLVDAVVEQFGDAFPELRKDPERVKAILREEEATFSRTLKNGIRQLGKYCEKLPAGGTLSGEEAQSPHISPTSTSTSTSPPHLPHISPTSPPRLPPTPALPHRPPSQAFKMYDTYGFPVDLTLLMCEEKGLTVDEAGYEAEMERAKKRSQEGGSFSRGGSVVLEAEQTVALAERMGVPRTDDAPKWVWDSAAGAGQPHASTLRAAIDPSKVFHESVTAETGLVGLIVESTPFYAEAGGQVCDLGTLTTAAGAAFLVEDVQRFGAFVTHIGRVTAGELKPGDAVQLCVDYGRRAPIAQNHTTTHMLNYALRAALEQDCDQRGSLCDAEKLRFDFAYPKPLTAEQLAAVQAQVNSQIGADLEVHTSTVALEQAMAINGLRAVFGQQCRTAHGADPALGSILRRPGVGQMVAAPDQGEWRGYSVEFCGGTHIARSSEPQRFVLISEEGLGGGNRRIVGLTGERAAAEDSPATRQ
ncbi:alanyl-tRNA synthetase [Emiliania huxleyi CCMP1516]|uniref:Alanine--tRNA ligase n=2 Tax=Emiliania huxleyi TaxID=2903 RepID=A0A0D3J5Z1_EMIH1|nr:alanyl-tRNA synthetase [Emiliania huxleyi CCMP1516]EOD18926.1 alanyl-tRNA synthetase [Emiliania huxleyi CCMP1516]|eukprot:XP_005771355.1 alanyl-tRNA synthetase [Emiliania huxleyi CCMP1516]